MAKVVDTIATPGEVDYFQVDLIGQVDYVVSALAASNFGGDLANPAVALFDSAGNVLAFNDDSVLGADPLLQFQAPSSGTYFLGVADLTGGVGSYTLVFDQAGPPISFGTPLGSSTF